jgi:hypothetical protein
MAFLRNDQDISLSRTARLNWQDDAELDALLGNATCLAEERIRALRIVAPIWREPMAWSRPSPAWCPNCVSDDVARQGECYERATLPAPCLGRCGRMSPALPGAAIIKSRLRHALSGYSPRWTAERHSNCSGSHRRPWTVWSLDAPPLCLGPIVAESRRSIWTGSPRSLLQGNCGHSTPMRGDGGWR